VLTGLGYSAHRSSLGAIVLAIAIVVDYTNRHRENDERPMEERLELCEEPTKLAMREIIAPILNNARPALGFRAGRPHSQSFGGALPRFAVTVTDSMLLSAHESTQAFSRTLRCDARRRCRGRIAGPGTQSREPKPTSRRHRTHGMRDRASRRHAGGRAQSVQCALPGLGTSGTKISLLKG
jgi:hypothetical protein